MEAEAAWIPCDSHLTYWNMQPADESFQMPNRTMEPPVWAPRLPVEYQCTTNEIFGSFHQTSIPNNSSRGQLVEYSAAQDSEVNFHYMEVNLHNNPIGAFEEAAWEFKVDMDMMKMKIHRYPLSLPAFDEWYTVPRMVAMGPYHHARLQDQPKQVKVKHVAAYHCVRESGHSLQELYEVVVSAAHGARRLHDKDVMEGASNGDFLPVMFYDACFFVQYMLWCTINGSVEMDASLRRFFDFNCNTNHIFYGVASSKKFSLKY